MMVLTIGLEPTTSTLPWWRTTHCAMSAFPKYIIADFKDKVQLFFSFFRTKRPMKGIYDTIGLRMDQPLEDDKDENHH